MGESSNSPARNTYDTAYWLRAADVMMRDYREGRRLAHNQHHDHDPENVGMVEEASVPGGAVDDALAMDPVLPRADTWTRKFVQWLNEQPDSWVEENAGQMVAFHSPEDVHVGMEAMTKAIDGKQELHYLIASVPSRGKVI